MNAEWTRAVVRVGDGRGFVVKIGYSFRHLCVITAAHCLPHLPPCHWASYYEERIYKNLLGPLGKKPKIWAECLFVDPVADLAVLGPVTDSELLKQQNAYYDLVETVTPFPIARPHEPPPTEEPGRAWLLYSPLKCRAWMLSLDGRWFGCNASISSKAVWVTDPAAPIAGGMSGSPIVTDDGKAIGAIATVSGAKGSGAVLAGNLPAWAVVPAWYLHADAPY